MTAISAQIAHQREARLMLTGFWDMLDGFVRDRMRRTAAEVAQIRTRPYQPALSPSNSVQ